MKNVRNSKDLFDGFDSNGNPTGKKVRICKYQNKECDWQSPFGDGAFLTCWYTNEEKCKLEEDENREK